MGASDKRERPTRQRDISQVEPGFVAGKVYVAVKLGLWIVLPRVLSLCEMFDLGVPNEVTESPPFSSLEESLQAQVIKNRTSAGTRPNSKLDASTRASRFGPLIRTYDAWCRPARPKHSSRSALN